MEKSVLNLGGRESLGRFWLGPLYTLWPWLDAAAEPRKPAGPLSVGPLSGEVTCGRREARIRRLAVRREWSEGSGERDSEPSTPRVSGPPEGRLPLPPPRDRLEDGCAWLLPLRGSQRGPEPGISEGPALCRMARRSITWLQLLIVPLEAVGQDRAAQDSSRSAFGPLPAGYGSWTKPFAFLTH